MPRKPIEEERHKNQAPRDRLWQAARQLRTFTLLEWQDAVQPVVTFTTCETYQQALLAAGYLEVVIPGTKGADGKQTSATYRLAKDSLTAPRLNKKGGPVTQGHVGTAMWRAMQILKVFDWHDIQRAASHPGAPISPYTVKTYLHALARVGYFQTMRPAEPGTPARYRLARDTGPQPPAVTRRKQVFDRNEGQFYGVIGDQVATQIRAMDLDVIAACALNTSGLDAGQAES